MMYMYTLFVLHYSQITPTVDEIGPGMGLGGLRPRIHLPGWLCPDLQKLVGLKFIQLNIFEQLQFASSNDQELSFHL